jgi:hypothetical protein
MRAGKASIPRAIESGRAYHETRAFAIAQLRIVVERIIERFVLDKR